MARALAVGRCAVGTSLLVAPRTIGALWLGDSTGPGGVPLLRALGVRDVLLGLGTLDALDPGLRVQLLHLECFGRICLRDEPLDAVRTHLVPGRHRGRLCGFERMHPGARGLQAKKLTDTHDRAASADACDKRVHLVSCLGQLQRQLWPRRPPVRLDVGVVGKLAGEKHIRLRARQGFGHLDAAEKAPCCLLTSTMSAPKLAMSEIRSLLIQSGMKIVTGCPSARPSAANEMPVFPLVASAIRSPGRIAPDW